MREIGFTDPWGQRWLMVGSHNSVVRVGEQPMKKDGCPGCGLKRKARP